MGGALDASLRSCVPEPLSILLVDDFGPFREALRVLLGSCADFAVVGEAVDGHSAIEMASISIPRSSLWTWKCPGWAVSRRLVASSESIHQSTSLASLRRTTPSQRKP